MAVEIIDISEFLKLASACPVFDVRSPAEFKHAHIPGAVSLPLFSDEERKVVGTTYKQESRELAIKKGLDFFGPKMRMVVEQVESICNRFYKNSKASDRTILVHCWRGGMRSAAIAWLLDLYGFRVYTLDGGYKKFRRHILDALELKYEFRVIGGYTGSGKTALLGELRRMGQEVIDLEALANHKGSAFGSLGLPAQPSQEMFENLLGLELLDKWQFLAKLKNHEEQASLSRGIWIEDESQRLGTINIPAGILQQMKLGSLYFLDIPFEERLRYIVSEYGSLDKEKMINAIIRIAKRLGGLETKTAVNALIEDRVSDSFSVLLTYYDKWYKKALDSRAQVNNEVLLLQTNSVDPRNNAQLLLRSAVKNQSQIIEQNG